VLVAACPFEALISAFRFGDDVIAHLLASFIPSDEVSEILELFAM
jgi:hypothetical protein